MCRCVYIYIYIYTHTRIHIHMYVCFVCVYVYPCWVVLSVMCFVCAAFRLLLPAAACQGRDLAGGHVRVVVLASDYEHYYH